MILDNESSDNKQKRFKLKKNKKNHQKEMLQDTKTESVTKLKNSKCDKTQKFKLWQNSKTCTARKKYNCDLTQIPSKLKKKKYCDKT